MPQKQRFGPAGALLTGLALAASMVITSHADAWGCKEHLQLTRIAVEELLADPQAPPEMKQWLKRSTPGLLDLEGEKDYLLHKRVGIYPRGADGIVFWSVMPDLLATEGMGFGGPRKVEPFGVAEQSLHFIDAERFMPREHTQSYVDDLSHKPKLSDFPRDMHDPRYQTSGMLPFRVEQCCAKLTEMIKAGKLSGEPGQYPRDESAAKWAGFLAHYAEDNTQPQHATLDYKSATYFPGKRGPNVHADVEWKLVDDEDNDYPALREEFWAEFTKDLKELKDPIKTDDPWQATLEVSLASYDALPLIGRAAAAAYHSSGREWQFDADKFFHFQGKVGDREMSVLQMKAWQMAWGVKRVERLWLKCWTEAPISPANRAQAGGGPKQ
jgi:hypothetical protein